MEEWQSVSQPREFPRFLDEWREANGENFTPLDYLNQRDGVPFVAAAQWLFAPDFIEYRGGVFWTELPRGLTSEDSALVDQWFDSLGGDVSKVERISNLLTLWDLFVAADAEPDIVGLDQLARSIGRTWDALLQAEFPERKFVVEVRDEDEGSYGPQVTFFSAPGGFGPHGGPPSAS